MNLSKIEFQLHDSPENAVVDPNNSFTSKGRLRPFSALLMTVMLVVTVGFTCSLANAATYFVDSNSGNDSSKGSLLSPWRTIAKANQTVEAGDTVVIKEGTYAESINPRNSGTEGDPITYTNHNSDEVLIAGSGSSSPVTLGQNYITIDSLSIEGANPSSTRYYVNILIYGSHNKITNCKIHNSGNKLSEYSGNSRESGITIMHGSYNHIEGNSIKDIPFNGIFLERANHTVIKNNEILDCAANAIDITSDNAQFSGILIENNKLGGSYSSDGIQFNGNFDSPNFSTDQSNQGAVIRGNVIFDNAENGIDLKGTKHILIEDNVIYGGKGDNDGSADNENDRYGGMGGIAAGTGTKTTDIIIRGNLIYDNNSAIQMFYGYKIYNNTILGNNRDYTGPNSSYLPSGALPFMGIAANYGVTLGAIKNNIIGGHTSGEVSVNTGSVNLDIDYNIYCNDRQTNLVNYRGKGDWVKLGLDAWKSALSSYSNIIGKDQHSLSVLPGFSSNLSLRPVGIFSKVAIALSTASAAIDKGGPLTSTANSGSGNIIYVNDAGYFCDGFGATEGDMIKVGNNNAVRITSVDYDKNMIVIDDNISWGAGDGVYFNFSGKQPDIGAVEFTKATIPSPHLKIVVKK